MTLPHFNTKKSAVSPDQTHSNHFNAKLYDGYGLEITNVYVSFINITETGSGWYC